MPRHARRNGPLVVRAAPAVLVLAGSVLLGAAATGGADARRTEPPLGRSVAQVREPPADVLAQPDRPGEERAHSPQVDQTATPVAVEIPALELSAPLVELGLDAHGALEVPEDATAAGWFRHGPSPGEPGAAVVVGHVDSHRGPGVFWRLSELTRGDRVVVHHGDGSSTAFLVDGVGRWPKSEFPTDDVYLEADGPELRLITCGGEFDERTRSYRDNVVVFATQRERAPSRRAPG